MHFPFLCHESRRRRRRRKRRGGNGIAFRERQRVGSMFCKPICGLLINMRQRRETETEKNRAKLGNARISMGSLASTLLHPPSTLLPFLGLSLWPSTPNGRLFFNHGSHGLVDTFNNFFILLNLLDVLFATPPLLSFLSDKLFLFYMEGRLLIGVMASGFKI